MGRKEGRFILSEKRIDAAGFRHERSIVIDSAGGEVTEFRELQKAYSLGDLLRLLDDAGFSAVEAFRDIDGQPASLQEFGVFTCRP